MQSGEIFQQLAGREHEQLTFCYDECTGLKAIIGIHDTTLGPALGGTRMWSYADEASAVRDVLRLSRGMTYKAAAAGLNLGGGKAVIIGNSKTDKNEVLFRSYGRFVQGIGGRYITAEDVGTSVRDMEWVRMETDYVVGISRALGGSGDPSPVTAFGTYQGIRASLKWATGSDSLNGRKIAVQGLGHVGYHLVKLVVEAGARAIVADIYDEPIKRVTTDFGNVEVVPTEEIHAVDCDVFAPCALGAVINDDTIPQLKCAIICGSANNILGREEIHAPALAERDILYAPDYVVNAGGLINVANELEGYNHDRALQQAAGIYDITTQIFKIAREEGTTTAQAANTLAERRIAGVGKLRDRFVPTVPRRMMRNMRTDL